MFEMFVKPTVITRVGVRRSQRWSSAVSVLFVLIFPFISTLRGERLLLMAGSLFPLFILQICSNVVSLGYRARYL